MRKRERESLDRNRKKRKGSKDFKEHFSLRNLSRKTTTFNANAPIKLRFENTEGISNICNLSEVERKTEFRGREKETEYRGEKKETEHRGREKDRI